MLHAAADRNVAAALRHFAANATVAENAAVLLVAAATPFVGAFHNAGLRLDPGADANAVVQEVLSFSLQHSRELILWASTRRDKDLIRAAVASGLHLRSTAVGMATYEPPGPFVVPCGAELERVADSAGAAGFAAVHESLIGDAAAVAHFASPAVLLAPEVAAFVVRAGGRPVACAMTVLSGSEAGVYWVATRADARRLGYAELVTRAAVRAGFEYGAHVVLLQSTDQGLPLYRKLGFALFTIYARYLTRTASTV
ncbi:GNAT family N-acetyltransferase [Kribbella sp. NPDC058245]|uniref:GNAT family N-acetyltransferase n=1 Tax=Kribbella sp. NPDC058245 TaxID=3346399 RepID=UPI0036E3CFF5